ncbi:MAG: DNA mismatch repair protein MutT [Nocardioides sp.]|nr:DNA mismatch repair protein MutT [Nocardioides sp.]
MPESPRKDVQAAGVVVFRPGRRVLLVHRPQYDDWSFPKGKLDPGEHPVAAAVREVSEETDVHVRLCRPLTSLRYPVEGGRHKVVHYWVGRPVGDGDVSGFRPNEEVDEVRWVPAPEAAELLTYDRDRGVLEEALRYRKKTRAIIVLRHGKARSRKGWGGDDARRPLVQLGFEQADRLVPLLAAYDVTRVLTSPSERCVQTVAPYTSTTGWEQESRPRISEEDVTSKGVARVVDEMLSDERGVVVCSHRPVLPLLIDALGAEDPGLDPGDMLVLHVRKREVVAVERHSPRR